MLTSLLNLLFGCRHRRTSFPITLRPSADPAADSTYVTCLSCGKRYPYDWEKMRIVK